MATLERSLNTGELRVSPRFCWDEYRGDAPAGSARWASTDRGWVGFTPGTHPDRKQPGYDYFADHGNLCCGNYLRYPVSRGPGGEEVHAVAYVRRLNHLGLWSDVALGYAWFHTIEEAKRWVEGNVRSYFGLPRE